MYLVESRNIYVVRYTGFVVLGGTKEIGFIIVIGGR